MTNMAKKLDISEPIGVRNEEEVEKTVVEKGLIAGVVFHHSNVRF